MLSVTPKIHKQKKCRDIPNYLLFYPNAPFWVFCQMKKKKWKNEKKKSKSFLTMSRKNIFEWHFPEGRVGEREEKQSNVYSYSTGGWLLQHTLSIIPLVYLKRTEQNQKKKKKKTFRKAQQFNCESTYDTGTAKQVTILTTPFAATSIMALGREYRHSVMFRLFAEYQSFILLFAEYQRFILNRLMSCSDLVGQDYGY